MWSKVYPKGFSAENTSSQQVIKESFIILELSAKDFQWEDEDETENEDADRARSLVFVNREEALWNTGQIEFQSALQLAHEKHSPDLTLSSFDRL